MYIIISIFIWPNLVIKVDMWQDSNVPPAWYCVEEHNRLIKGFDAHHNFSWIKMEFCLQLVADAGVEEINTMSG